MQAGRLRDRVIILNVTTARSPSGHPVETVTEWSYRMGRS